MARGLRMRIRRADAGVSRAPSAPRVLFSPRLGPDVEEAVRVLDSILRRMEAHQEKKRSMMRRLSVAEHFFAGRAEKH
jgi:hypothetical protein